MGASFNNIHIRNTENLDFDRIKIAISDMMKKYNYELSNHKDNEGTDVYVNMCHNWISVYSNSLYFNTDEDLEETLNLLSKALKTDVLGVACFDSDYVFLNLINTNDKINAWANVGSNPFGVYPRETDLSSWKNKVKSMELFESVIKADYTFVEDVFTKTEDLIDLPYTQVVVFPDSEEKLYEQEGIHILHFTISEDIKPKGLPKFEISGYGSTPLKIGEPNYISVYNWKGGESKGLFIGFAGDYVENEEIYFTDVSIEYTNVNNKPVHRKIQLEKRKDIEGIWLYCWRDPEFYIYPQVVYKMPMSTHSMSQYLITREKREFTINFTPQGNPRKVLDIFVYFIPFENSDGQYCWYTWKGSKSKEDYIIKYNEENRNSCCHNELNPEDFDL